MTITESILVGGMLGYCLAVLGLSIKALIAGVLAWRKRRRDRREQAKLHALRNCTVDGVEYWWDYRTREQWAEKIGSGEARVVTDRAEQRPLTPPLGWPR